MNLAVYGTLRKRCYNHDLMQHCKYLGTTELGGFVMHNGGCFPYAVEGRGTIVVEVYEVSEQKLHELDTFEPYSLGYRRIEVEIPKMSSNAFLYHCVARNVLAMPVIESGDWVLHIYGEESHA